MKLTDLKNLHVYQLTRDVENPKPDRRITTDSDWVKWVKLQKGARFQFIQKGVDIRDREVHIPTLRYFDSRYPSLGECSLSFNRAAEGREEQQRREFLLAIVEALEPAPITLTVFLSMREREDRELYSILESGLRNNLITWEQLDACIAQRHADDLVEYPSNNRENPLPSPVYVPVKRCGSCSVTLAPPLGGWCNEVGELRDEEYCTEDCAERRLAQWARMANVTRRKGESGVHFIARAFNKAGRVLDECPASDMNEVARKLSFLQTKWPDATKYDVVNSDGSPLLSEQTEKVSP